MSSVCCSALISYDLHKCEPCCFYLKAQVGHTALENVYCFDLFYFGIPQGFITGTLSLYYLVMSKMVWELIKETNKV